MYQAGGVCYIYLCYGLHTLFNIVTNHKECPHAVLIRALKPLLGTEFMLKRRDKKILNQKLTAGPGTLSQALGISLKDNGTSLMEEPIWVEDRGVIIQEQDIVTSPRIGVAYAGQDALRPWRFQLRAQNSARKSHI